MICNVSCGRTHRDEYISGKTSLFWNLSPPLFALLCNLELKPRNWLASCYLGNAWRRRYQEKTLYTNLRTSPRRPEIDLPSIYYGSYVCSNSLPSIKRKSNHIAVSPVKTYHHACKHVSNAPTVIRILARLLVRR